MIAKFKPGEQVITARRISISGLGANPEIYYGYISVMNNSLFEIPKNSRCSISACLKNDRYKLDVSRLNLLDLNGNKINTINIYWTLVSRIPALTQLAEAADE